MSLAAWMLKMLSSLAAGLVAERLRECRQTPASGRCKHLLETHEKFFLSGKLGAFQSVETNSS